MNPFFIKKIFSNSIVRHLLYWIGLIIFFGITWGTYDNDYIRSFTIQTFSLPARMMLVYISVYLLLPIFFIRRKFIAFSISYLLLLFVISIGIQRPLMFFYVQPNYLPGWQSEGYFTITELVNTILDVNIAAILPLGYSFFTFYHHSQQKALTLEKEKIEAQLIQLRNQVHPHFLFNTLNSLYALIIKKSDAAEIAVIKLSKLMRYMLYEANVPKVSLTKEIEYLKNYVDLEKLRFSNAIDISFNFELDKEYQISPFLLIPFIENAFKHGTSSISNSWIVITIFAKQGELMMQVENSKFNNSRQDQVGGIGFKNVKKRLELLYPDQFALKTEEDEMSYRIILNIKLTKTSLREQ